MKKVILLMLLIFSFVIFAEDSDNINIIKGVVLEQNNNILKVSIKGKESETVKEIAFVIGPRWFVDYNEIEFKKGENIEIEYSVYNKINHIRKVKIILGKDKIKRYSFINDKDEFLWMRHGFNDFGSGRNRAMRTQNRNHGNGKNGNWNGRGKRR
ncbi:hypothetical protein [Haliovirga abyssi]|uniref:Uncharacterized protein n=1 Tax=Haliovirga abyssi TaxID=2996794 RepID=A0AAU9D5H4_9FUSO|nr:hypothetical protein [Haliovirga abyssi]BDU51326.1 hypothetical protein HLVA_18950 [Haliovirga abyssi]